MYGWAEHALVFDEYKINGLLYEFFPSYDGLDAGTVGANNVYGQFHTAIDPASTLTPTGSQGIATLNNFMQQGDNIKTSKVSQVKRVYFKPKVASQVFGGGIAGRLIKAPWLKTTEANVDHRGFHAYLYPNNGTPSTNLMPITYNVYITYYIQFRGSR